MRRSKRIAKKRIEDSEHDSVEDVNVESNDTNEQEMPKDVEEAMDGNEDTEGVEEEDGQVDHQLVESELRAEEEQEEEMDVTEPKLVIQINYEESDDDDEAPEEISLDYARRMAEREQIIGLPLAGSSMKTVKSRRINDNTRVTTVESYTRRKRKVPKRLKSFLEEEKLSYGKSDRVNALLHFSQKGKTRKPALGFVSSRK